MIERLMAEPDLKAGEREAAGGDDAQRDGASGEALPEAQEG